MDKQLPSETNVIELDENGNLVSDHFRVTEYFECLEAFCADKDDDTEEVCGLFVVSFDIRQGNVLEWQIPSNLNLKNVEFKAMASGLHLMQQDVM